MSASEATWVAAGYDVDGVPIFAYECGCGAHTGVRVEDLAVDSGRDVLEFAVTYDYCGASLWATAHRSQIVHRIHRESDDDPEVSG